MANRENRRLALAAVAGAGLLAFLLWRAKRGSADEMKHRPADHGQPCWIELRREGLFVDDQASTVDEAIRLCRARDGRASVFVSGDARWGDWRDLEGALADAAVDTAMRTHGKEQR